MLNSIAAEEERPASEKTVSVLEVTQDQVTPLVVLHTIES